MAEEAGKSGAATGGQMTDAQKKWFASIIASMKAETGKTLEEWVAVAKTTPETSHGKRVKWFKAAHGLGQNRASGVLHHAFPPEVGWNEPAALRATLWKDPAALAILQAVEARVRGWEGLIAPQRKGYTAWSRDFTFASVKPVKGGVLLGLAIPPSSSPRLGPAAGKEGWSERLASTILLTDPAQVDTALAGLLRAAFEAS